MGYVMYPSWCFCCADKNVKNEEKEVAILGEEYYWKLVVLLQEFKVKEGEVSL